MTAIHYPDCQATSPNGHFSLEARSPHNGVITYRDGRSAEGEFEHEYQEHQKDFRYRLIDNSDGRVLWERWQPRSEDSPHEVVVADDGWSVLRTHGFRPELIAVSPAGEEVVRVKITGGGLEHFTRPIEVPTFAWSPTHLEDSTAGLYWSQDSWPCFFQHDGRPHFAWRTYWGQRAVIDLGKAALRSELEQADPAILHAMTDVEKEGARRLLSELDPKIAEIRVLLSAPRSEARMNHPLRPRLLLVTAAVRLVGLYRLNDCLPFLRNWEAIDYPSHSTGSTAMPTWWLQTQYFRPIVHHALRLLDEEPAGWATYHFRNNNEERFPVLERIPNRHARIREITPALTCEDVLRLVGAPDHISRHPYEKGGFYVWPETWDYDSRIGDKWVTTSITWEELGRKASRITKIEESPSAWLVTDERLLQIRGN